MDISSLTNYDVALLRGSWLALTNEEYQCEKHYEKLALRADADVVIPYERKKKGCGVYSEEPRVTVDGFNYHMCLCHKGFHHPNFGTLVLMHEAYEKGILPFEGPLVDQPAKIIDIFNILNSFNLERQQELQKKNEEVAKRQAPKGKPRGR